MARIEHIKRRLDNGLGFASQNILAVWMASAGEVSKSREVKMPVLHLEAEETEQAVQALRVGKGHLHVTLENVYLRNLGVKETARRMDRAVSTIHSQLDQADRFIDVWLQAQQEAKDVARARAAAGSFTT